MSNRGSLRIGLVRWSSYPSDIRSRRVLNYLTERGHEVHFLCENDGTQPPEETIDGVHVERVPPKNHSVLRQVFYHATFVDYVWYQRLKLFLKSTQVDLLHVVDLFPLPTVLHATHGSLPIVADLRELYPESMQEHKETMRLHQRLLRPFWRYKRMEREALKQVDGLMTESSVATDHYAESYGFDRDRIVVSQSAPDLDRLREIEAQIDPPAYPDEFVVTYVGKFTPQRDLETLLRSIAALEHTAVPVRLLMVGDGPDYERLVDLAEELNVSDQIEFTGWVEFKRMFDYLAASDVGICLCRAGNMDSECANPNKIFQYMFMGLPIIVADLAAMRQTIERTGSGLVVPPEDSQELAEAIERLHEDAELAHELGQNGQRSIREELHFANEGDSLLKIYRTVLG